MIRLTVGGGDRNDFETAHANSVPIPRDKNQLSSMPITTTTSTKNTSRANAAALEISITSTSDKTAAELAAEQAKKQSQAEKNALPVWHTQSTVDPTAITAAGAKEAAEKEARALDGIGIAARTKEEEDKKAAAAEGINGVQADGNIHPLIGFLGIGVLNCNSYRGVLRCPCCAKGEGRGRGGRGRRGRRRRRR